MGFACNFSMIPLTLAVFLSALGLYVPDSQKPQYDSIMMIRFTITTLAETLMASLTS